MKALHLQAILHLKVKKQSLS